MKRKLTALILALTMLVSLSSAVAADDTSATPTVEEILKEYHQKAFQAQLEGETETASTWSRRGNAKTLEQKTVDTLTAAGYEAYNVTAENYDALETELNTDFASMGLDPDGSYIVVISGEDGEESESENKNSRAGISPEMNFEQGPGGGTGVECFTHTYEGSTYYMRYMTITAAAEANLKAESMYTFNPNDWFSDLAQGIIDTYLIAKIDALSVAATKVPLGTIASLLFGAAIDENYIELNTDKLELFAFTYWTINVIQVFDEANNEWVAGQCSAYAISKARCAGYLYDPIENDVEWYNGEEYSNTQYSPKYNNTQQRLDDAAKSYKNCMPPSRDQTGDIEFYFGNETGNILYNSEEGALFTHEEKWIALY